MNYYERHLGDYARDAAHLSLLEHGVYSVLLDRYYATEQGIPEGQAHRVARARTDDEHAAVDAVLAEFFTLTDGVWTNRRVEEELEKARIRIETARSNGKKGGRKPSANPVGTQQEPAGFNPVNRNGTQDQAHQAPSIHLSTKEQELPALPSAPPPADLQPKAKKGNRLPADWTLPDDWAAWAKQARPDLNPADVAARFADHWHAKAGKDGVKLDWQATWRNWVRGEKTASVGGWQRPAEPRRIDTPEETRKRMSEIAPRRVSDPQTVSAALAEGMAMLRGTRND